MVKFERNAISNIVQKIQEILQTFVWWQSKLPISIQVSGELSDFTGIYLCYFDSPTWPFYKLKMLFPAVLIIFHYLLYKKKIKTMMMKENIHCILIGSLLIKSDLQLE